MVKPKIRLVVTGSVAAIKTGQLAQSLKLAGYDVAYSVTEAAWQFLNADGKYKIPDEQLAEIKSQTDFTNIAITLVAPASADYLSKMASGEITFQGEVFVAPAMNYMMWQHPAVQENVRKLMERGVKFLGPVIGAMACRDYGYGRFADVKDIASALNDDNHPLHLAIEDALFVNSKIPAAVKPSVKNILLVVQENNRDTPAVIRDLESKGYNVKCAAASVNSADFGIEVCTEHYQLNTSPPGMEHIRLPEWADVLLVYPSNPKYLEEMRKGGAASFIGCVYLASKAPVVVISTEPGPILEQHGVKVLQNYNQFGTWLKAAGGELAGKQYLVLGGSPRERVDSFRFYANNKRPEDHGVKVAAELTGKGASVTFVCPAHVQSKPDGAITSLNGKK